MKKAIKLIFTSTFLLLSSFVLTAQDNNIEHQAPTLQLGLNGLSFAKGDLDAQLIMEIIAEKQSEIKLKVVQNMFLQNLQNSGGTVYNYGSNLLKVMVEEQNQEIRTRLVLENTVNLVFAYSFAEYIRTLNDNDVNLILTKLYSNALDTTNKLIQIKNHNIFRWRDVQIIDSDDSLRNEFYALLLDISSEVIRNNSRLKELGLMRISYSTSYEYINKYRILEKEKCISCENNTKWGSAKELYKLMEKKLNSITGSVGVLNHCVKNQLFIQDSIKYDTIPKNSAFDSISIINGEIKKTIKNITNKWHLENDSVSSIAIKELYYCSELMTKIKKNHTSSSKSKEVSDMVFLLNNKVIPLLQKNLKYNHELYEQINNIETVTDSLVRNILKNDSTFLIKNKTEQISEFIKLVSTLYEFDKASTYSDYLNLLSDIDNLFTNQEIKTALSSLNSYVKNNVSIKKDSKDKEVIDFNIESFLQKLSTTSSDRIRRFQFHFTVGANNVFFLNELNFSDGTKINNNSFISEKIGIKFKIINQGAWAPKNIGESYGSLGFKYIKTTPPKEPLVSNIHLLVYGSGILYNITTTSTNKNFNYPIVGSGFGLTFYNALDLNFSIGLPLQPNLNGKQNFAISRSFFGLGFDIQFAEYINHLGKKRKNNLNQKQLSN